MQFGVFHKYLSIDEEMVPFFGRHTAKMFMKGKPIRYGHKLWVLASDNGYPYQFDTYCDKKASAPSNFMSCYRSVLCSEKCWWPLFVNGINMLVVASWRICCAVGGEYDKLEFRRLLVGKLVSSCQSEQGCMTGPHPRPFKAVRTQEFGHHLQRMDDGKQRRCKACAKNAKCVKCNIPLHFHCEKDFHTK